MKVALSMAFDSSHSKTKIEELSHSIQEHVVLLFGFTPNVNTHHWLNNGVLAPLSIVYRLTFLKGGKRIKKDWLFKTLYANFFGERHSFEGNVLSSLVNKPELPPLFTEDEFASVYSNLEPRVKQLYKLLTDACLAKTFDKGKVEKAINSYVASFQYRV